MTQEVLSGPRKAVDHLLDQYNDYLKVSAVIDELRTEQVKTAIRLAKAAGLSFTTVLTENREEIKEIGERISFSKRELQRISDEMTFADPVIWVMYKYRAYAGTSKAIVDMEDLRAHCRPDGYICTKRYSFLRDYLRENESLDLEDKSSYSDDLDLAQFCHRPEILALHKDESFLSRWQSYEYYQCDQRVAKWENYLPENQSLI